MAATGASSERAAACHACSTISSQIPRANDRHRVHLFAAGTGTCRVLALCCECRRWLHSSWGTHTSTHTPNSVITWDCAFRRGFSISRLRKYTTIDRTNTDNKFITHIWTRPSASSLS